MCRIPSRHYLPARGNRCAIFLGTSSLLGFPHAVSRHNFLLLHLPYRGLFHRHCDCRSCDLLEHPRVARKRDLLGHWFSAAYLPASRPDVHFCLSGNVGVPLAADGNIALQAKTVAQWFVSLSCVVRFPVSVDARSIRILLCPSTARFWLLRSGPYSIGEFSRPALSKAWGKPPLKELGSSLVAAPILAPWPAGP